MWLIFVSKRQEVDLSNKDEDLKVGEFQEMQYLYKKHLRGHKSAITYVASNAFTTLTSCQDGMHKIWQNDGNHIGRCLCTYCSSAKRENHKRENHKRENHTFILHLLITLTHITYITLALITFIIHILPPVTKYSVFSTLSYHSLATNTLTEMLRNTKLALRAQTPRSNTGTLSETKYHGKVTLAKLSLNRNVGSLQRFD